MTDLRDRDLVRLHWPVGLRAAFDALFSIDDAMAEVALRAPEPVLAAIKLAWWREQLQALDVNPPPPEPRLAAVAEELLPRGISGAELAVLEDGWLEMLQAQPRREVIAQRGANLFALAARLLGNSVTELSAHGGVWALADLARKTGTQKWQSPRLELQAVPRKLRPIGVLVALAVRDNRRGFPLEPEGTPGRAWALIRHRMTGRLKR